MLTKAEVGDTVHGRRKSPRPSKSPGRRPARAPSRPGRQGRPEVPRDLRPILATAGLPPDLGGHPKRSVRVRAGIATAALGAVFALAAPAVAGADYGAIAVNPNTGGSGVSFNHNRKGPALRRAQRECPGNCRIVVWVRNQCAAVVQSPRRFVPGVGPTKRKAIRNARQRAAGDRNPLVAWTCSG